MNNIKQFIFKQNWSHLFVIFLILWFVANILQAVLTEAISDEAYYLLYGKNLAWGYFDHPPMIGLMTFFSNLLFEGNLSIRFSNIVLHILTIIVIWKLIDEKQPDARKVTLFFIIVASMAMFTIAGFTAIPDTPYIFFTALFLLFYKKFLERESWLNTIILGLAIAGMMYSKYHTVLVVGFIVLSNLKLIARPKAWMAAILALILLIPHICWQFSMDFPSIKYHLYDRNRVFEWSYFLEYLPNQLVTFNPGALGLVVYILFKYKINSLFERGMYFLIAGFLIFFWAMSFRGHVQPQWTVACTIPMILLIYRYSLQNQKIMRFLKIWITPVVVILLIARIILITDLLPMHLGFTGKELRDKAVQSVAGELPVAFTGSFQRASLYPFFTKRDAFVLSSVHSRQTQFDIWQKEMNYQGKTVFICSNVEGFSKLYEINGHTFHGHITENFQSVNRLKIEYTLNNSELHIGDTLDIHFKIHNPTGFDVDFQHSEFPVTCKIVYRVLKTINTADSEMDECVGILKSGESISRSVKTVVPELPAGNYLFALSLFNNICASQNSEYVPIKITSPKNDR